MSVEHPALKNFSPTWEGFKHIAGKALKWGAIGAAAFVVVPMIISAVVGALPWFSSVGVAKFIGAASALQTGAIVGAVLGGISGAGSVFKAIDERRQDVMFDHDAAIVARQREAAFEQEQGKKIAMNNGQSFVSPNVGFGRQQDRGIGA